MSDDPTATAAYTVTVTDDQGNVVFVGRPVPEFGDFTLTREAGKPARLTCDVLDLSAGLTNG